MLLKCNYGDGKSGHESGEGGQYYTTAAFCIPPGPLMPQIKWQADKCFAPKVPSGQLAPPAGQTVRSEEADEVSLKLTAWQPEAPAKTGVMPRQDRGPQGLPGSQGGDGGQAPRTQSPWC